MLYGLYLSAAGLQMQEYRQSVQANNLANAQTVGFKRDMAMAQARLNPAQEDSQLATFRGSLLAKQSGGVWAMPTAIDLSQGPLKETDNPHDMALDGPGFFTVQGDASGKPALTRDGRFTVNTDGQLIMASNGRAVLNKNGQPIHINPNETMTVTTGGDIVQDGTTVAQLGIVNVAQSGDVEKAGTNLFRLRAGKTTTDAPANTQVVQQQVEQSGVDPMVEMVDIMEGQRVFDANAKMISYQDTTLQLLNGVGRVTQRIAFTAAQNRARLSRGTKPPFTAPRQV